MSVLISVFLFCPYQAIEEEGGNPDEIPMISENMKKTPKRSSKGTEHLETLSTLSSLSSSPFSLLKWYLHNIFFVVTGTFPTFAFRFPGMGDITFNLAIIYSENLILI